MENEIVKFDYQTMLDLWNGLYYKNSSVEIKGETYTHIDTINTSKYSDGVSHDYIIQRKRDNKLFIFNWWDAGDHNGYLFQGTAGAGENEIIECFPKTIETTTYE